MRRPAEIARLSLACMAFAGNALAFDFILPKNAKEAGAKQLDHGYRVKTAKVSFYDPHLLAMMYPEVAEAVRAKKIAGWEPWLLENFAVVSETQLSLDKFNTPIDVDKSERLAIFRRDDDGRAGNREIILPGGRSVLVNVKGIGNPPEATGLSGLLPHAVAVSDAVRSAKIDWNVWQHGATGPQATRVPFTIDLGFDIVQKDGSKVRAGVEGRLPQRRADFALPFVPERLGIPTHFSYQATLSGAIFDLGNITFTDPKVRDALGPATNLSKPFANDLAYDQVLALEKDFHSGKSDAIQKWVESQAPLDKLTEAYRKSAVSRALAVADQHGFSGKPVEDALFLALPFLSEKDVPDVIDLLARVHVREPEIFQRHLKMKTTELAASAPMPNTPAEEALRRHLRLFQTALFSSSLLPFAPRIRSEAEPENYEYRAQDLKALRDLCAHCTSVQPIDLLSATFRLPTPVAGDRLTGRHFAEAAQRITEYLLALEDFPVDAKRAEAIIALRKELHAAWQTLQKARDQMEPADSARAYIALAHALVWIGETDPDAVRFVEESTKMQDRATVQTAKRAQTNGQALQLKIEKGLCPRALGTIGS